ncbi:MAG: hypothetical protein HQ503_05560, partial [Rhodospirillales bacterium]|nr:hypothetical protein [Rhodospirillales bacterium]
TLTMFDLMLTFWAMAGLYGLISAWRGGGIKGWAIFAAAVGFGILSKGPVILVFLLPAALFAPYWTVGDAPPGWGRWYASFCLALVIGAGIALSWAVPAGVAGGDAYRNAIFWGQSAGRVVSAFDHSKPIWWYLPYLPILLMPWIAWPSLLRSLWRFRRGGETNPGLRLMLVWVVAALIILSAISGKRIHYLLPVFPAAAIFVAVLVSRLGQEELVQRRWDMVPAALIALLFGVLFGAAPMIGELAGADARISQWTNVISPLWALIYIIAALWFLARPPAGVRGRVAAITVINIVILVGLHGALAAKLNQSYNLSSTAQYLAKLQKDGYAIANWSKYHGQFNFLGRLAPNIAEIGTSNVRQWLKINPKSKIIAYHYVLKNGPKPEFTAPFRGKWVAIWDASQILKDPSLAYR